MEAGGEVWVQGVPRHARVPKRVGAEPAVGRAGCVLDPDVARGHFRKGSNAETNIT